MGKSIDARASTFYSKSVSRNIPCISIILIYWYKLPEKNPADAEKWEEGEEKRDRYSSNFVDGALNSCYCAVTSTGPDAALIGPFKPALLVTMHESSVLMPATRD